jgi:uncharacterized membrane protein
MSGVWIFSGFQYRFYTTVLTFEFSMLTILIYTEEKFYQIEPSVMNTNIYQDLSHSAHHVTRPAGL